MKLYQGTQRIEVIVKKQGGGSSASGNKQKDTETAQTTENEEEQENPSSLKKITAKVNISHAFAVAKQFVNHQINYKIASLGLERGDEAYEDRISRQYEIATDYGNMATSIAMGAWYGSAGGPVGAVAGAVIAGTSTAINIAYKYKTRERDFTYKMFKEETAIEYQRARANINLTNGRLR